MVLKVWVIRMLNFNPKGAETSGDIVTVDTEDFKDPVSECGVDYKTTFTSVSAKDIDSEMVKAQCDVLAKPMCVISMDELASLLSLVSVAIQNDPTTLDPKYEEKCDALGAYLEEVFDRLSKGQDNILLFDQEDPGSGGMFGPD